LTSEQRPVLIGWPDYIEQSFKTRRGGRRSPFLRRTIADRVDARAELGRGAPNTVLILLDDVGHVNDTSHDTQHGSPTMAICVADTEMVRGMARTLS